MEYPLFDGEFENAALFRPAVRHENRAFEYAYYDNCRLLRALID